MPTEKHPNRSQRQTADERIAAAAGALKARLAPSEQLRARAREDERHATERRERAMSLSRVNSSAELSDSPATPKVPRSPRGVPGGTSGSDSARSDDLRSAGRLAGIAISG